MLWVHPQFGNLSPKATPPRTHRGLQRRPGPGAEAAWAWHGLKPLQDQGKVQGAAEQGTGTGCWLRRAHSFYSLGPRGAEGRCCWGHFPGNLAPPPPERGLRYFRMETVPWPRGVVLPRWPLRPRNFQTEVMTCGGRGIWCQRPEGESGREGPGPSG